MSDKSILQHITDLVGEEHLLRGNEGVSVSIHPCCDLIAS
jgi:hypothetical protein